MQVRELAHILSLSNFLPSLPKLLAGIIDRELASSEDSDQDPRGEYEATYANSAWVIGACAQCIAERPAKEWANLVDLSRWIGRVVEKWGWSGKALEGLADLVRARYARFLRTECF